MRNYEAMIILEANPVPDKIQESIQKVKDIIVKYGGAVQSEIKWGKRALAYSLKKKREGYYILLYFQAEPSSIGPVVQAYRLLDQEVLRAMIIAREKAPAVALAS